MSPLPILAIALAIVLTGVLAFRLHAFLTLIVAALAVAALTPRDAIERYELARDAVRIDSVSADGSQASALARRGALRDGVEYGIFRLEPGAPPLRVGSATVAIAGSPGVESTLSIDMRDPGTDAAGAWVATPTTAAAAARAAGETIGQRVAQGFGRTALDIGIIIAMASILGGCLMAARGAERIVVSLRRALGPSRTPLAFLGSGFLLGIPMFAEAVFYLLLPLAKAMWLEARRHYVLFVLAIVAGATMTHSLVPPTPGPLFVADAMGVDIGLMIRQGMIVAAVAAVVGYAYAVYADRRWGFALRPTVGDGPPTPAAADDAGRLPPLILSLFPILLPVVLISANSALGSSTAGLPSMVVTVIGVFGDKNLALTISAAAALALLVAYPDRRATGSHAERVRRTVRDSIVEAGEIILIIAAGGALGATLRQAGMAELAAATVPEQRLMLLPIAWGITALVRVAQGSATVAMITAVGIVGPIALASQLPYHPVYVALAIGAGSKIGMWMNDSGFWVISRMSGMTEAETLKTASVMVFIEGCAGLLATMVLAIAWPLL